MLLKLKRTLTRTILRELHSESAYSSRDNFSNAVPQSSLDFAKIFHRFSSFFLHLPSSFSFRLSTFLILLQVFSTLLLHTLPDWLSQFSSQRFPLATGEALSIFRPSFQTSFPGTEVLFLQLPTRPLTLCSQSLLSSRPLYPT